MLSKAGKLLPLLVFLVAAMLAAPSAQAIVNGTTDNGANGNFSGGGGGLATSHASTSLRTAQRATPMTANRHQPITRNLSSTQPLLTEVMPVGAARQPLLLFAQVRSTHSPTAKIARRHKRHPSRHKRKKKVKVAQRITYTAPGSGDVFPNGQDNPSANLSIVACDPNSTTGTIRTTFQLGSPGLRNGEDPSRNYTVYTIRLSASTQILVYGDASVAYHDKTLCDLSAYDPRAASSGKVMGSVTFTFASPRAPVRDAQGLFNHASPIKVTFNVSGDTSS